MQETKPGMPPRSPDPELAFWLALTRRLPRLRGAGAVAEQIKRLYLRQDRTPVRVPVRDFRMDLDPNECIDGGLLFYPQIFDHHEIQYMVDHLREGDTFVDAGSHIGFYTLVASGLVGPSGRVVAIEANPQTCRRLEAHVSLNDLTNVTVVNKGLSDRNETLRLGLNLGGNVAGSSFLSGSSDGVEVPCEPLQTVLESAGIERVDGAKMDIEGFEYKVLDPFLTAAPRALHPRFLVIEDNPEWAAAASGHALTRLREAGYRSAWTSRLNHILVLDEA